MKHTYVYDHYYKYDEITEILKKHAEAHPGLTELDTIGQTPEGRQQWILKVTNKATGGFDDKPALYVEGNIHAGEVTGSMCAMYMLDYFMSNLDDAEVAWILKKRRTAFAYSINRNPLLLLLNALPRRIQLWAIRLVLK